MKKKVARVIAVVVLVVAVIAVSVVVSGASEETIILDWGDVFSDQYDTLKAEGEGYLVGDADNDWDLSVTDATVIQRHLAGMGVDVDLTAADVDGDGDVSVIDATVIQRKLIDLPVNSNVGEWVGVQDDPAEYFN